MPQFHQVSPFFLYTTPVPQHFPGTKACCLLDIAKISSKTACTQAVKIWKSSHLSWILKIKMKNLNIFPNGWERSVTLQNPFTTRLFISFGRPVNQTVIFLPYRQLTLEISWLMLLVSSFQWWQWPDYCNSKIDIIAEYFSLANEHSNIHHFSQGPHIPCWSLHISKLVSI